MYSCRAGNELAIPWRCADHAPCYVLVPAVHSAAGFGCGIDVRQLAWQPARAALQLPGPARVWLSSSWRFAASASNCKTWLGRRGAASSGGRRPRSVEEIVSDADWPFAAPAPADDDRSKFIYDFQLLDVEGHEVAEALKGKVTVIVNIATKCGSAAANVKSLVQLHDKYGQEGLEVLAFPCAQFGNQEHASLEETRAALEALGASGQLRLMMPVDVNGGTAHPLYRWLKSSLQVGQNRVVNNIKWNFTRFVVGRDGTPLCRVAHDEPAAALEAAVRAALGSRP